MISSSEHQANYNWLGVMDFIQAEYQKNTLKQKQWVLEKQVLLNKITKLQSEMKSNEVVHLDLLKRIQMLEYCLRSEKHQKTPSDAKELNYQIKERNLALNVNLEKKPRDPSHREFLQKILNEIGIALNQKIDKKQQEKTIIHYTKRQQETGRTCLNLIGHLDGVRDIFYSNASKTLISVSEDCLIKFWDINITGGKSEFHDKATLREYTGPLFAVTGTQQSSENSLIFTGGSEGIIKAWESLDQNSNDPQTENRLKGTWMNFEQQTQQTAIWQLVYRANKLISSSSDSTLKVYDINCEMAQGRVKNIKQRLKKTFINKDRNSNVIYNPTSVDWINNHIFVNGYSNSNTLTTFDLNADKIVDSFKFQTQVASNLISSQTNKILYNQIMNLVISANEDKCIRSFDLNSKKLIKKLNHHDSVTSLSLSRTNKWCLYAAGHDGLLKVWDLRKNQCIEQIETAHNKKFDEAIHSVIYSDELDSVFTAGADGLIKMFNMVN